MKVVSPAITLMQSAILVGRGCARFEDSTLRSQGDALFVIRITPCFFILFRIIACVLICAVLPRSPRLTDGNASIRAAILALLLCCTLSQAIPTKRVTAVRPLLLALSYSRALMLNTRCKPRRKQSGMEIYMEPSGKRRSTQTSTELKSGSRLELRAWGKTGRCRYRVSVALIESATIEPQLGFVQEVLTKYMQ